MSVSNPVSVYCLSSGEIGVPLLAALVSDSRVKLVGVGSQPDRPAGRKRSLIPTPVSAAGAEHGLTVERVESVNHDAFLSRLGRLDVDLLVVASFGQILREPLLALPRFGCLNVHASLLPRHRGASPISAAILAGDVETGISFMKMDRGLDTGPVYERRPLRIYTTDTAGRLEDRLGQLAAEHLAACIWGIAREGMTASPQDEASATYASRLRKEDARIDWTCSAESIERMVRAYIPWPKAFTTVPGAKGEQRLQIVEAAVEHSEGTLGEDGEVIALTPSGWLVACGRGSLVIRRVVPAGRREMSAEEFLRGFPLRDGVRLGASVF